MVALTPAQDARAQALAEYWPLVAATPLADEYVLLSAHDDIDALPLDAPFALSIAPSGYARAATPAERLRADAWVRHHRTSGQRP